MARAPSSNLPKFKRARKRKGGFVRFLVKLALGVLLFTLIWVLAYRFIPPPITATMAADLFSERGLTKDWMSLDEMDRDMVRAAIAAEDSKFCQHSGFDLEAIENAMKRNASGGRIRGGSTISQQTAKNAFLWQGGGYFRKGLEAYFTFLIEKLWGKRRIMEVYLNIAETGIGTYGANAGSMRYFGHDASAMSESEAARIAAVLPLPKSRGAIAPQGFTRRYGNTIAARMKLVARDGLDACVYEGREAPPQKAPPPSSRPTVMPGAEYETASPPAPEGDIGTSTIETVPEPVEADPVEPPAPPAAEPPPPPAPAPETPAPTDTP